MSSHIMLDDLTRYPRMMILTSIAWFFVGGAAGLTMILTHLWGFLRIPEYNVLLTLHGVVMPFGGLFQLMMGLSLLRAGFCYGKPLKGLLVKASYIVLNLGMALITIGVIVFGVRTSYTLMFPLPAVGVF